MSWLLNELIPINVNSGAEVYKFIPNEMPTDTNKAGNLLGSVCRNGGNWAVFADCDCAYVHQKALGGKVRDDTE